MLLEILLQSRFKDYGGAEVQVFATATAAPPYRPNEKKWTSLEKRIFFCSHKKAEYIGWAHNHTKEL